MADKVKGYMFEDLLSVNPMNQKAEVRDDIEFYDDVKMYDDVMMYDEEKRASAIKVSDIERITGLTFYRIGERRYVIYDDMLKVARLDLVNHKFEKLNPKMINKISEELIRHHFEMPKQFKLKLKEDFLGEEYFLARMPFGKYELVTKDSPIVSLVHTESELEELSNFNKELFEEIEV